MMITAQEAEARLEEHRRNLPIPPQAKLAHLEKRSIELAESGEIETVLPMSAPEEDVEAEDSEGAAAAEAPQPPIPHYTETLAWVGRFAYQFLSWELAVDGSGRLIRVRKSR